MNLTDKVKEQAEHAVGFAKQGVSQGQAKFDQLQAKRQSQTLFRRLGEAYYAQQRQDGSAEAVTAALSALDQHVAAQAERNGDDDADDSTADPVPAAPGQIAQAGDQ